MQGGLGNDTYYVDNVGDLVIENVNSGVDSLYACSRCTTLSDNIENLMLTGVAAINGTGNTLNNQLVGNTESNTLNGCEGDDLLDGGVSDLYNLGIVDILNGGAGNDTLLARGFYCAGYYNGGADTKLIDFSQSDCYTAVRRSVEGAGVEVDLAASKASSCYLKLLNQAWADINGQIAVTGINQDDRLSGAGNDSLYGQNGADTFIGGLGKDSYNFVETIAATDTVRIATCDSLIGSYDMVQSFTLGAGNIANADILDLENASIAINGADNVDNVAMISSHSIANGISFDNLGWTGRRHKGAVGLLTAS